MSWKVCTIVVVVSVFTIDSDDLSSNQSKVYHYSVKLE